MDRRLIEQKLESLRACVARVETRCPQRLEELRDDPDAQDIVTLNLTRAVQQCVDIGAHVIAGRETPPPATMGQTFDVLVRLGYLEAPLAERMKKAVGFRNIAIHNYEAIEWAIVHSICTERLQDFRAFARAIWTSFA